MTTSAQRLDDEELLHLAIEASHQRRHGDAISYLKQVIEKSATNHKALYLLAAQHAQIGLTERAIEEFNRALVLEPNLEPARFQLGLLLLCNARTQEALTALAPLAQLSDANPFLHFGRGLERLCHDDFAACQESLKRGMALNATNAALNVDMQRILDAVSKHLAESGAEQNRASSKEQPGQILLSAYTKTLN